MLVASNPSSLRFGHHYHAAYHLPIPLRRLPLEGVSGVFFHSVGPGTSKGVTLCYHQRYSWSRHNALASMASSRSRYASDVVRRKRPVNRRAQTNHSILHRLGYQLQQHRPCASKLYERTARDLASVEVAVGIAQVSSRPTASRKQSFSAHLSTSGWTDNTSNNRRTQTEDDARCCGSRSRRDRGHSTRNSVTPRATLGFLG